MNYYFVTEEVEELEVYLFDDIIQIIFGTILYLRVKSKEEIIFVSTQKLGFATPSSHFIGKILNEGTLNLLYPQLSPISHNILGGIIKLKLFEDETWIFPVKITNRIICTFQDTNEITHQIYRDTLQHTRQKVINLISHIHLTILTMMTRKYSYAYKEEEPSFSLFGDSSNVNTANNDKYDVTKDIKILVNSLDVNIDIYNHTRKMNNGISTIVEGDTEQQEDKGRRRGLK